MYVHNMHNIANSILYSFIFTDMYIELKSSSRAVADKKERPGQPVKFGDFYPTV